MKKIAMFIVVLFVAAPLFSQSLFESLTEKYADKDGFSASLITHDMFEIYLKKQEVNKESPVYETLNNLDNILLVSHRNFEKNKDEINSLHSELLGYYKDKGYSLFKTEKQMGDDVKVYMEKGGEEITSLALVTASDMSVHLVELNGLIDMANLSKLGSVLNLRGLENLYRINSSSNRLFSNRYNYNWDYNFEGLSKEQAEKMKEAFSQQKWFNEEKLKQMEEQARKMSEQYQVMNKEKIRQIEEHARQMAEKQHKLSKEQLQKIEQQAREMAEKQMKMQQKYMEMAEKYGREPIFIGAPGDTNTVYYIDGKRVDAEEIKGFDKEKIESIEIKRGKGKQEKTVIKLKTK